MMGYVFLGYAPYIYSEGKYKKQKALIRKVDGTYMDTKPIIYTKIDTAIMNIARAG